jgi:hypothetical protein
MQEYPRSKRANPHDSLVWDICKVALPSCFKPWANFLQVFFVRPYFYSSINPARSKKELVRRSVATQVTAQLMGHQTLAILEPLGNESWTMDQPIITFQQRSPYMRAVPLDLGI